GHQWSHLRHHANVPATTPNNTAATIVCEKPRWKAPGRPSTNPTMKSTSGRFPIAMNVSARAHVAPPRRRRSSPCTRYAAVAWAIGSAIAARTSTSSVGSADAAGATLGALRVDGTHRLDGAETRLLLPEHEALLHEEEEIVEPVFPNVQLRLADPLTVVNRNLDGAHRRMRERFDLDLLGERHAVRG